MKNFVRLLSLSCALGAMSCPAYAATLVVPTDYPGIQSAIDAAVPGDTVYLQAGTYRESLKLAEGIHLVGESAESVVLSNGPDWAILQANGIGYGSVENLTLLNDSAAWTTGIYFQDAAIDLLGVRVKGFGNGVTYRGRYDYDLRRYVPTERTPVIAESSFEGNNTALTLQGAMSPVIQYNSFLDNLGSALYLRQFSSPQIDANLIEGNGTGIYLFDDCLPAVTDNDILRNTSGMVLAWRSHATIVGNRISENSGDGIWSVSYSSPAITNNIVSRNGGDGLWMFINWAKIQNNTIVENAGDGISATWYASLSPDSNIIAHNGGWGIYAGEDLTDTRYRGNVYLSYNNLYANAAGDYGFQSRIGTGNLFEDPLFRDRARDNYELRYGSPAIDAGTPDVRYLDPDGSRNDMGAYGGPDALPATSADPLEEAAAVSAQMVTLPDSAFKNEPTEQKASVEEKFGAVISLIDAGNQIEDAEAKRIYYQGALNKLTNDLLKKCDGHFGGNPKNDWVTSYEAQSLVYPMLLDLINEVKTLLATL